MNWTWANVLVIAGGVAIIVGCTLMFRHRDAVHRYMLRKQTEIHGTWFGNLMASRTTPMTGVGVPAIGGIVIGVVWILGGIFGQPGNA